MTNDKFYIDTLRWHTFSDGSMYAGSITGNYCVQKSFTRWSVEIVSQNSVTKVSFKKKVDAIQYCEDEHNTKMKTALIPELQ